MSTRKPPRGGIRVGGPVRLAEQPPVHTVPLTRTTVPPLKMGQSQPLTPMGQLPKLSWEGDIQGALLPRTPGFPAGWNHSGNVRGRRIIFLKHPGNRAAPQHNREGCSCPPPRPALWDRLAVDENSRCPEPPALSLAISKHVPGSHRLTPSPDSKPFRSELFAGCADCPLPHEEV